ncbi:hypothetical protein JOQ06_021478 [Pogonophryne albipinna]|uniref:Uncharacterized protein n=1 Tax=Pogonophryne albipinna TaxID=1090488 RepID=A0AAD6AC26_9TELE|nr:hypothetical protein JOQ06_021478 [Pogonophryne albipinna]
MVKKNIPLTSLRTGTSTMLCQKGMQVCKDVIMVPQNTKWLFNLQNIGPEAMKMKYECGFTVEEGVLDKTKSGKVTILLSGQKEVTCAPQPTSSPPSSPPSDLLSWILIGLLALMFLYSCLITAFYIRLMCSDTDPENTTYVYEESSSAVFTCGHLLWVATVLHLRPHHVMREFFMPLLS